MFPNKTNISREGEQLIFKLLDGEQRRIRMSAAREDLWMCKNFERDSNSTKTSLDFQNNTKIP